MTTVLAFYKPFEVLCQFSEVHGRRTLKDFIDIQGVYPAGRLDYRSEGLLILTGDGKLIHQLTDPRSAHPKVYFAQVEGLVTEIALTRLRSELVLPDLQTRLIQVVKVPDPGFPTRSKPVRGYHPTDWLRLTLYEGKKHQVRRMTAAVGLPTLRLIRYSIGGLDLDDLTPGQWYFLSRKAIQRLTTG